VASLIFPLCRHKKREGERERKKEPESLSTKEREKKKTTPGNTEFEEQTFRGEKRESEI
jgi:hypothetical protein